MSSIEGTLTGNETSSNFTPSASITEVKVYNFTGKGTVYLIEESSGGKEINLGLIRGAHALVTTDLDNIYKLQAEDVEGDVDYYIGP